MAAKPNVKFMVKGRGVVHTITTKRYDQKNSRCATVRNGHDEGVWKGKGLSPEAALDLNGCGKCGTEEIAAAERKARMTPAQKRAETIRMRDETMAKTALGGKKPKASKPGKEPSDKPARRGPRGGDANERMKSNVEEHAVFAEANGWAAKAWNSGTNEWTCEAHRNGETLRIIYQDGRTMYSRVILVGGGEVRLRNSANWRKHAEGKSKVKATVARRGKRAAREPIADDRAAGRELPFILAIDDHDTIIESLLGKTITWRRQLDNRLDSAKVPSRNRNCRVRVHPKSDRAMLSFMESQGQGEAGEMLGGERTVYLDKILKAR